MGRQAVIALAAGLGLPAPERAVDLLVRRALLDLATDQTMPEGSDRERLRLHPLLRELAAEHLDDATQAAAAQAIATFYAGYANAAPDTALSPDAGTIAGTLEWVSAASSASLPDDMRDSLVAALCSGMRQFWRDRSRTHESLRYLPWGVTAAATQLGAPPSDDSATEDWDAWRRGADRLFWLYLDLGFAYQVTGRLDNAQTRYEQCLALAQLVQYHRNEGVVFSALGQLAQARGQKAEAERYLIQALAIDREVLDRRSEGVDLTQLGQIAQARGQLAEAERYFTQSLAIRREVQDRRGDALALAYLGLVAEEREQWEEAETWYRQGLAVARKTQDAANVASIAMALGRVLIGHRGQHQEGCQLVEEVIALYEEIGLAEQAEKARAIARELGCTELGTPQLKLGACDEQSKQA
jgi:tetratricopeptide (TPR) repeat protein